MKVLVCGGRDYTNKEFVYKILDKLDAEAPITEIIHGDAYGADSLAQSWAIERGRIQTPFPADWVRYGKPAGAIRNREMIAACPPDYVVAFPGNKGTKDMISVAQKKGFPVKIYDDALDDLFK